MKWSKQSKTARSVSYTHLDVYKRQVEDTFIRQELPNGKEVKVYFTYNPPRNPYDWINEWVAEKAGDPTYLIHHSTYLDDKLGFLSKQMKAKIARYKETDPDYYRWMYLGEVTGLCLLYTSLQG